MVHIWAFVQLTTIGASYVLLRSSPTFCYEPSGPIRSNFNTREFDSRELVQLFQLYSKRSSPFLTIFGHKIAIFFLHLLITKRDLISIKEGQNLRFEIVIKNNTKSRLLTFERNILDLMLITRNIVVHFGRSLGTKQLYGSASFWYGFLP